MTSDLRKAILHLRMGRPIPTDLWMKLAATGIDMSELEHRYAI